MQSRTRRPIRTREFSLDEGGRFSGTSVFGSVRAVCYLKNISAPLVMNEDEVEQVESGYGCREDYCDSKSILFTIGNSRQHEVHSRFITRLKCRMCISAAAVRTEGGVEGVLQRLPAPCNPSLPRPLLPSTRGCIKVIIILGRVTLLVFAAFCGV